jgi:hypothetical protein
VPKIGDAIHILKVLIGDKKNMTLIKYTLGMGA